MEPAARSVPSASDGGQSRRYRGGIAEVSRRLDCSSRSRRMLLFCPSLALTLRSLCARTCKTELTASGEHPRRLDEEWQILVPRAIRRRAKVVGAVERVAGRRRRRWRRRWRRRRGLRPADALQPVGAGVGEERERAAEGVGVAMAEKKSVLPFREVATAWGRRGRKGCVREAKVPRMGVDDCA